MTAVPAKTHLLAFVSHTIAQNKEENRIWRGILNESDRWTARRLYMLFVLTGYRSRWQAFRRQRRRQK